MLRYKKYCAMGLFILVAVSFMSVSSIQAAEQTLVTHTDSTWSNNIYYIARLTGEYGLTEVGGYQDIQLMITAVDDYELYINNELYNDENDGDWKTVDVYDINLGGSPTIDIAVKVTNHGAGDGNGLKVGITAGTDVLGTWTKIRESKYVNNSSSFIPVSWWTFDEQQRESLGFTEDNWYSFDGDSIFDDNSLTKFMSRAQLGNIPGQLNKAFPDVVETIAGYVDSGVDIGSDVGGGIRLKKIDGENIALGKPSEKLELTDGNLESNITIGTPLSTGDRYVDLGRIYRVNKMTLTTGFDNPISFDEISVRGYSVEISLDNYRWEEVGIIHEIGKEDEKGNINEGGYDNYSVEFPGEWARYVKFVITEVRQKDPQIGEILIFGEGYTTTAYYESEWMDFDSPDVYKNFDSIEWTADIPEGTSVTVQTMTKAGVDADPSPWSKKESSKTFAFDSPEPATHLKYRVNLETQDLDKTPIFKSIDIKYSSDDQPVTYADGYVTPNAVAMGKEETYTYTIGYDLADGQNIKDLKICVPGYSTLNYVIGSELADTLNVTATSSVDTLTISFDTPITEISAGDIDTLYVSFNTTLLRSSHSYKAFLYNSGMNDGAGGIKIWDNRNEGSTTVIANKLVDGILTDVEALPKVFTPNNDGINDFTVIEFRLAKVETDVLVKIFSTEGRLVTTINDDFLYPRDYRANGDISVARSLPGYWNGEDEDGDLVPPGIYIYQVVAETDDNDVIEGGTVVVAY